jgi:FKBP-type peptidyl-prolyl cis-trans isomerase FkpA
MTEVTRVPLQPIAKGSLTKLWIGIAIGIVIGIGLAVLARPAGSTLDALFARDVEVKTLTAGSGPNPGPEDVVFVRYKGTLASNGEMFDESQDIPLPVEGIFPEGNPLPLAQMVPGFRDGAVQMQKGGKYELFIPSELGYGDSPPEGAPIPPNADLKFEVEMVDFMSDSDFQRRVGMLQEMMQQQGGPGGGPPAGPPQGQ